MTNEQKMACPSCNADIFFTVPLLIAGASFECSRCQAQVRLSGASTTEVRTSYEKYVAMKKNTLSKN